MVDWLFETSTKPNQISDFLNLIVEPVVLRVRDVAIDQLKERLCGFLVIVVYLLAMRDDFSDALVRVHRDCQQYISLAYDARQYHTIRENLKRPVRSNGLLVLSSRLAASDLADVSCGIW